MKTLALLCAFCFVLVAPATATKYYVKNFGGNDGNLGRSATAPFQHIDHGITVAAPYDTVIALMDNYPITAPLTINKPLTLLGQGAQLDGSSWSSATPNKRLLVISNTNDVLVDGFVFKNLIGAFSIGVYITGSGRNITLQRCRVTNVGWVSNNLSAYPSASDNNANGILVAGSAAAPLSQITIRNDTINNCATGVSEALTVVGNVDTFTIANNLVHNISNIGIDCAGSKTWTGAPAAVNYARNGRIANNVVFGCNSPVANSAGIYLDGAYNCVVSGNTLHDNAVGISLGQEVAVNSGAKSCSRNKVINNVIYRNAIAGVLWGDGPGGNSKVVNNLFVNNTLFKNRTGAVINNVTAIGGTPAGTGSGQYGDIFGGEILIHGCDSATFENNILFPLGLRRCIVVSAQYTATHLSVSYNSFSHASGISYFDIGASAMANSFGNNAYTPVNVPGLYTNTITGYPGFVDTTAVNFRLTAAPASPCINAGNPATTTTTVGTVDFDGRSRIVGSRIDVGAFESQGSLAVSNAAQPQQVFVVAAYPNPTTEFINIQSSMPVAYIVILDLTGRILATIPSPASALDFTTFSSGMYQVVFVSRSGERLTKKIVKQ